MSEPRSLRNLIPTRRLALAVSLAVGLAVTFVFSGNDVWFWWTSEPA